MRTSDTSSQNSRLKRAPSEAGNRPRLYQKKFVRQRLNSPV